MSVDPKSIVLPGDLMLYSGTGFFSWVIRHASNRPEVHSEVYIGNGKSVASRNGKGVATYPVRFDGLMTIRRPIEHELDWDRALAWQASVTGFRYDWPGLWKAFVENKWDTHPDAYWCSEHSTEFYQNLGVRAFPPDVLPSSIAPGDLATSLAFTTVWRA